MDDEIRAAGRRARAETEAALDVDRDLAAVHARAAQRGSTEKDFGRSDPFRTRGWVAVAAAVAIVATAGGLWLLTADREGADDVATPGTTTASSETQPATTVQTTTTTATTTSAPATTTVPTTTIRTTSPEPTGTGASSIIAVSSGDPPPKLALDSFASIPYQESSLPAVAIGELGVIVGLPDQNAIASVGFSGEQRTIQLQGELADPERPARVIAYGPGDVAYAFRPTGPPYGFEAVAIPLSGPNIGTVVARSEPLDSAVWVELPTSSFGHGPDGIVARARQVGATLIGYVDVNGDPTTPMTLLPHFPEIDGSLQVSASNLGTTWQLEIDGRRSPQPTHSGPAVPAPTTNRQIVYATHLGEEGAVDNIGVVALLSPDGTGTWASLPPGVDYLASDSQGTVFGRNAGGVLELSLLADGLTNWRSLRTEFSGVTETCVGCTDVVVATDGTPISYDRASRVLTRHSTPAVEATLPASYGDAGFIWHASPDDVVYLQVEATMPGDHAADLVAVTLADGDAGREIGRWTDVTGNVGDSELVATPDGLVTVNCCGPDLTRPAPGAAVRVPWLDRNGEAVRSDAPYAIADVTRPTLTIRRLDPLIDAEREWSFEPGEQWQPRGMPNIALTHDGGFIATTFGGDGTSVWRGWSDGSVDTVDLGDAFFGGFTLDTSGRVLVANNGVFLSVDPFNDRTLAEYPNRDVDIGPSGEIELSNVTGGDGATADPVAFANAIAGPPTPNEIRVVSARPLADARWAATVTTTNLFDDSAEAVRWEMVLGQLGDGRFEFRSGVQSTVCQPGRGHQEFESAPCS